MIPNNPDPFVRLGNSLMAAGCGCCILIGAVLLLSGILTFIVGLFK